MKIKKQILFLIFIVIFFSTKNASGNEFTFEGKEIEILNEEKKLIAKNGVKIISDNGIVIFADNIEYDEANLILKANGNIKIVDELKDLIIEGKRIVYFKNEEKISILGKNKAFFEKRYEIQSEDLDYFIKKNQISSKKRSTIIDDFGNKFSLEDFLYKGELKQIKSSKLVFLNKELDHHSLNQSVIDLNTNEIIGKNLNVKFDNSKFGSSKNEPRLKGNAFYTDNTITVIDKGVFTTCSKTGKCPAWTITSETVTHDKSKKQIQYKNAWLKIYDKPVLYFPKFFHPDPTVKRQSGFLVPKLETTRQTGTSLALPYFKVISDSQDITLSPRIYSNKLLNQVEYRSATKNSYNIFDFSFIEKDGGSKGHLFANSKIDLNFDMFDTSSLEINFKKTTNDTYLKYFQLVSPLIKDKSVLDSNIDFNAFKDNLSITASMEVYEDLSKKKNDRYSFVYPYYDLTKTFDTVDTLNGVISFQSDGHRKKYDTNVDEFINKNNILFESSPFFSKKGLKYDYNLLLKNVNLDSNNSTTVKSNEKSLSFLSMLKSSYPLRKIGEKYNEFIIPSLSVRYSPNKTKNIRGTDSRISSANIFSLERIGDTATVEGGASVTIGNEYKKLRKDNSELISMNIAKNFRNTINDDLPIKNGIGQKSSDIVGNLKFNVNQYLDMDYDFSYDNNLSNSNYDSVKTILSLNNFITSFEYLEENNLVGKESYVGNETKYTFDDENSISFSTRKNKRTNLTEFYNLIYQYKNDCLTAGLEYSKNYYVDNDIQPEEKLMFTIRIIPFSSTSAPLIND